MDELRSWLDRWDLSLEGTATRTWSDLVAFVRRGEEPAVLKVVDPGDDKVAIFAEWLGLDRARILRLGPSASWSSGLLAHRGWRFPRQIEESVAIAEVAGGLLTEVLRQRGGRITSAVT